MLLAPQLHFRVHILSVMSSDATIGLTNLVAGPTNHNDQNTL